MSSSVEIQNKKEIIPENYIDHYGSFHKNEKQKACEIVQDLAKKIINEHGERIKDLRNPYEAASYFLYYVNESLEDEEIDKKLQSCSKEFFDKKDEDFSEFFNAIEWSTIDVLKDLFNHRIS